MNLEKFKKYSPATLRLGIAIVFLWFGFFQIKNPDMWTRMIPEYVQSIMPMSVNTLIYINGFMEVVLATLLLLGFYTRTVSLLLSLHLLHIVTIVGYGATGARDFALAIAAFSVFLNGTDEFCLDKFLENKRTKKSEIKKDSKTVEKPIPEAHKNI